MGERQLILTGALSAIQAEMIVKILTPVIAAQMDIEGILKLKHLI